MCPVPKMRRRMFVDTRSITAKGEACIEIPEATLIRKLVLHPKSRHYLNTEFARMANMLEEITSEKIDVNEIEPCKLPTVPGKGFYIQGLKFPTARCKILEHLMVGLHERGVSCNTKGKVFGGTTLANGAAVIYKDILDGEISKYLNLAPR